MIEKLDVSAVHTQLDPKLHNYVMRKIGKLDRYLPKHARESVIAEVVLKEEKIKTKKECICEIVMQLPHDTLMVAESTMNMYAAVDIVEAKLKNMLKRYKETHSSLRLHRRVLARLRHKTTGPV